MGQLRKSPAARRKALRAYLAATLAVHRAQRARDRAFKRAYPIGAEIRWIRGQYAQVGEVVLHGYQDRLKVLNFRTGREVWLDGSRVCHE